VPRAPTLTQVELKHETPFAGTRDNREENGTAAADQLVPSVVRNASSVLELTATHWFIELHATEFMTTVPREVDVQLRPPSIVARRVPPSPLAKHDPDPGQATDERGWRVPLATTLQWSKPLETKMVPASPTATHRELLEQATPKR
jgi:hypothetical protein